MAMTMLTEKSDLINIRKSEGDDDENEDDRMFATRRHSVAHSLQNVYKSSKENEFALEMPSNILNDILDTTRQR